MRISSIKSKSRSQTLDIGGNLFLKGKLQFRFIRKWVDRYNADIINVKKIFPEIFTIFKRKQAFRLYKKNSRYRRNSKRSARSRYKPKIQKFRFKFDILKYDLDLEFVRYYSKFRYKSFLRYRIHYDSYPRRVSFFKRLFYKKQRLKIFLNFKDYQFKNYIKKLKSNKFYLFDFYYFLEYRIDTIFFRIFFFQNFKVVRQYINSFGFYVNKQLSYNFNYLVQIGDLIQLSKNIKSIKVLTYLMSQLILVPFPKYFEVNYNILSIVVKSFFIFKNNMFLKSLPRFLKTKKNKRFLASKNKTDINSLYFLVSRQKKYKFIFKKRLHFLILQPSGQLYFPFKFSIGELNSIFEYY